MARVVPFVALVASSPTIAQTVTSPDGRLTATIETTADGPRWSLTVAGRPVIAPSSLGLEFERYAQLGPGLVATGAEASEAADRYTLPVGKVAQVVDRYRQLVVHYAGGGDRHRRLDVVLRAYDTGVALRYVVPAQPDLPTLRLTDELTQFAFPGDYRCTGLNLGSFRTSHEGEFDPVRASLIRAHNRYDLPLTCDTGAGGPTIAIAEAAVENWPVMYLAGIEAGSLGVAAKLSRRLDDPLLAVRLDVGTGVASPWRVVMVARDAGHLIENTLLTSLNPAPQGDFAWVRPGKTAWDWWSGPLLAGVPRPGSNMPTERAFIDLAASLHLPFMTVDEGWYVHSGSGGFVGADDDPTRTVPAIDLPALVAYGRARDIGLILWMHWALVDRDMERVLSFVERNGVKGIKVDFMDRDDQEMVGFYHRLAAATARHHLLLDLHGATHPWGMTRTWPNFITQEGVFGAEQNKWTRRVTARHNITLAYTRMLAGPMDYTPGGFRNVTPAAFQIRSDGPETQTTRAAELAKYVIFESPLQSVADSPDAYRGQAGLDFLAEVPTNWDEVRFLAGTMGEHIALARRRGTRWFIGAMTDAGRTVRVPLGFLGAGRFVARTWGDGHAPTDLVTGTRPVRSGDALTLTLAPSGGAAAIVEPVR